MWLSFALSTKESFTTEKQLEILKEYSKAVSFKSNVQKINTFLNSKKKMKISSKRESIHSVTTTNQKP